MTWREAGVPPSHFHFHFFSSCQYSLQCSTDAARKAWAEEITDIFADNFDGAHHKSFPYNTHAVYHD